MKSNVEDIFCDWCFVIGIEVFSTKHRHQSIQMTLNDITLSKRYSNFKFQSVFIRQPSNPCFHHDLILEVMTNCAKYITQSCTFSFQQWLPTTSLSFTFLIAPTVNYHCHCLLVRRDSSVLFQVSFRRSCLDRMWVIHALCEYQLQYHESFLDDLMRSEETST